MVCSLLFNSLVGVTDYHFNPDPPPPVTLIFSLLDTREQGYKHGCKTAACEAAGLCACSSGGGPAAPLSEVLGTNAPPNPEAAAAPAAVEQGGEGGT